MKIKVKSISMLGGIVLGAAVLLGCGRNAGSSTDGANYYVNAGSGDDANNGRSPETPFRSLEKASLLELQPGDTVFLAASSVFRGSLSLANVTGAEGSPVVITSYGAENGGRATIDARGFANGVSLENCNYTKVENMVITADGKGEKAGEEKSDMRCGVLVTATKAGEYGHIELHRLDIRDVFFEEKGFTRGKDEVKSANGTQRYGWGIRFINSDAKAVLVNLVVSSCEVKNVAHTGIKFTGKDRNIRNIRVVDSRVIETGGPGIQMSNVVNGMVRNNYVSRSGSADDSRKWGRGSGLWTWGSADILIEHNYFLNANGPADSAGCHIDFNCNNVVVQYNFSANNAGGFCEILGNNYNCAYRYNVSVNDGHRVKGQNGAFQEGKTFWLSGYQGSQSAPKGPFNSYFYNNTIFVSKDIPSRIAVGKTTDGVFMANNIFYIEGESAHVLGDQYKPEKGGAAAIEHVVFRNNLYLAHSNWPKDALIQDEERIIGDPKFANKGGFDLRDYIPENRELVKDRGIPITKIPGDSVGLVVGLEVARDILGNKITGNPDLGAIEL